MSKGTYDPTAWTLPESERKAFPALSQDVYCDVAIIGGGLAGLLSAYLLAKAGKKVCVFERSRIGCGVTELTTAFLTQSIDTDFADLIKDFGLEAAKELVAAHGEAIALIETIVREHHIECEFMRCSNYVYANEGEDVTKELGDERAAAKRLGLDVSIEHDTKAFGFKQAGYMEVKEQAKFHPTLFIHGLVRVLEGMGVALYEKSEVVKVEKQKTDAYVLHIGDHTATASWVVSAVYNPFKQPWQLFFKKGMYVSYVMEIQVTGQKLQEGIYEDTHNPYHYLRIDTQGDGYRVIAGGEDHRRDVPVDKTKSFNALTEYISSIIPRSHWKTMRRWTGPILEPIDGLAYVGPMTKATDDRLLYAFAFSGNGMTYSGIAARIIAERISGKHAAIHDILATWRLPKLRALITKGYDYGQEMVYGALINTLRQPKQPRPGSTVDQSKK